MGLSASQLERKYEGLKTARSGWDTAWKSLSELFLPGRWRHESDNTSRKSPEINTRLINSTGVLAMRTLMAGMQGGMTSPMRPWFRIRLKGDVQAPGLNAWLDEVTERMRTALYDSNFYNAVHSLYGDLGTFGTGLLVETADENGLRFHLTRPGEFVIDVNAHNEADTFFRRVPMSARQIVERFGKGKCPDFIISQAEAGGGADELFDVIHGVFPRADLDVTASIGSKAMPFVSVYWLKGGGEKAILSEGGYRSFPAFAPRWDVNSGDVYGRSPAMDVIGDARMLQAMSESLRKMQHKISDPPLVADSSLKAFGVDDRPGAINFADAAAVMKNGAITPIQQPESAALKYTMETIREVEEVVRTGLYADLFRMLIDDSRRGITATEIQARQQEKLSLIGPVVERLHKELLSPLIARTFDLMDEYMALPPPPDELFGQELDVSFESALAQAQKLAATSAIDQGWAFVLGAANADPMVLDVVNRDAMIKGYLERVGMPEGFIMEDAAIERIRAERAKAQAAQRQAEAEAAMTQSAASSMADLSAAAKNLGQTPVGADDQTLLQTLLGGL